MTLYRGKCLTWINSNVSICLWIFHFFMYYYFSVLYPVDVQGMLFRYNTFCCGYSNVMILFTGSLWVHENGNETRFVHFGKKICQKYLRSVFCGNCMSDACLAIALGRLVWPGISPGSGWPVLNILYRCFMEMTGSDQTSCCFELVRKETIKKEDASFLQPVLRLTLLWKVF